MIAIALFAAGFAVIAHGWWTSPRSPWSLLGAKIFNGEKPIAGRIVGQDLALPAQATGCANCHTGQEGRAKSSVLKSVQTFAPRLTAAYLTSRLRRRGGPPSSYDLASFCSALRTGVDPVRVIIPRAMPRYLISSAQCEQLWIHLTGID